MPFQYERAKAFWEARAGQYENDNSSRLTNLEEDERLERMKVELETEHVFRVLKLDPDMRVLDLGSGIGAWTERLAKRCGEVVGVEYCSKMNEIARQRLGEDGISNVKFVVEDATAFSSSRPFDVIFVSGLVLYIPDDKMPSLLRNMSAYSRPGTKLFLREATGLNGRHEICDKYSEALKTYYSALYRPRDELIQLFNQIGFRLVWDDDMFEEGSPLNKWNETRLRVYLFTFEPK